MSLNFAAARECVKELKLDRMKCWCRIARKTETKKKNKKSVHEMIRLMDSLLMHRVFGNGIWNTQHAARTTKSTSFYRNGKMQLKFLFFAFIHSFTHSTSPKTKQKTQKQNRFSSSGFVVKNQIMGIHARCIALNELLHHFR